MAMCPAPDLAACECAGCAIPTCDDGMGNYNDCVCASCANDAFCSDPANCTNDGACDPFNEGCVCADCFTHPSCAGQVEICGNGMDDNGDMLADCADPFCVNDPVCIQAACGGATAIAIGATMGNTTGGTTILEGGCQTGGAAERVYTFTSATSGFLSITLASMADLGFYVQTTCGDAATEVTCEDAFAGGTNEVGQVPVTAGVPVTIVVDGYTDMDAGPFTLTLAVGDGCVADMTCDVVGGEPCTCADCVGSAQCGFCDNDAICEISDACTCAECAADPYCSAPTCTDDGICDQFNEGCSCTDCANVPNCP
jgi:hypothetical protein